MQLFGSLNDIASSLFKMFEFYYFVEYFIIPYTSICIRLSQLYQELCDHCVVIVNDGGGWDRRRVVDSYQGVGGRTGSVYYLTVRFFLFVPLSFGLSCPASFLSEQSMIAVVSVSLFLISFHCL